MTSAAQPGQEQRMDDHYDLGGSEQLRSIAESEQQAANDQRAARPTADLGEDGDDLVVRLRAHADNFDAEGLEGFASQCGEAADRLILYREALEAIFVEVSDWNSAGAERVRDVLSRSGG